MEATATPETGPVSIEQATSLLRAEAQEEDNSPVQAEEQSEATEEAQAEAEPQEEEAEPTYRVKIDGEEVEVTQSDLLKGYSRTQDYKRKTEALASERRAVEARAKEVEQSLEKERAQYVQRLTEFLQASPKDEPPAIDLLESDPIGYMREKAAWEQRQARRAQAEQELRNHYQQAETKQREEYAEHLKREAEALSEKWPEYADAKKGQSTRTELRAFLKTAYGYQDGEIDSLVDHRAVLLARDAMLYRRLQAAKPKAEQKVQQLPKVVKPGVKPDRGQASAEQRKSLLQRIERGSKAVSIEEAARFLKGEF